MTTPATRRILIVDDDADVLAGLAALLSHSDWDVVTGSTGKEALRAFVESVPDVVLLDVMLPDSSGLEVLDQLKAHSEEIPVVMMSGVGTIDVAVQAMKLGAETFISKPFDYENLELVLTQMAKQIATRRELAALRRSAPPIDDRFGGISEAARSLESMIARVAPAPSPVLLQGESGSGKGVVAKMIHQRSPRGRAPFVDLNCASLSAELLESELFGHEKGAFTDAKTFKSGLLEMASHGTVFLDEVGELQPAIQGKLLKVLEDKRFRRVGGVRDISVDIRLIAASNRDLAAEVAAGRFRQDLFYRLNVVRIVIPPLRDRLEDLPLLAGKLLAEIGRELGYRDLRLSERALRKLSTYPWPGNVRELRNVLERAALLSGGGELKGEHLHLEGSVSAPVTGGGLPGKEWDIRELEEVVSEYVSAAVEAASGNVREAARRLAVSPSTVYARMARKPNP